MIKEISVIGSGTMGNGIAHSFALHGFKVILIDISADKLETGMALISRNLDRQVSKGLISEKKKLVALSYISISTDIKEGVKHADLIIEAATESLEVKRSIFKQVDIVSKQSAILASNTSSISISEIAAATSRPEQCIGMHFMNPVPVMKLVEVIKGLLTSEACVKTIMELAVKLDKVPVQVNDSPGFVANRILMPMINEAIYTLYEGVAGAEEIDTVMKLGMSHPMGPLQLADFIGLDVCLAILNVLYLGFENPKYAPCPLLTEMVNAGKLGVKSGTGFYEY